jgi:hypothetical protein
MNDKSNRGSTQTGMTEAQRQDAIMQKGMTIAHLAQALGGTTTQGQAGNAPAASTPAVSTTPAQAAGNAPAPAATTQKP